MYAHVACVAPGSGTPMPDAMAHTRAARARLLRRGAHAVPCRTALGSARSIGIATSATWWPTHFRMPVRRPSAGRAAGKPLRGRYAALAALHGDELERVGDPADDD